MPIDEPLRRMIERAQAAWKNLKTDKNWAWWREIGECLDAGRRAVMRHCGITKPIGATYNAHMGPFLQKHGFDEIDAGVRNRLQNIMDHIGEVEAWRRTLTDDERMEWNHPNAILRHWSESPYFVARPRRVRTTTASPKSQPSQARPSMREILERRRERYAAAGGTFDTLTREERGMPPIELANVQHPDYPEGVTYDVAFRQEHGRTVLFTVTERQRLAAWRQLLGIIDRLGKLTDEPRPSIAVYRTLRANEKDMVEFQVRKVMPKINDLVGFLESLGKAEPEAV